MTLTKDLVTPDARLKPSRINCHAVNHYRRRKAPETNRAQGAARCAGRLL